MKPRILIAGQTYIDFIYALDKTLQPGQSCISDLGYAFVPGGEGAYMAVCASRLGADVVLCTSLGNDSYGTQLKKRFEKEGVDNRFAVMRKNEQTGLRVISRESGVDDRCVLYPGANSLMTQTDLEDGFSCYPDAVLMSYKIGEQNVLAGCELANKDGIKVYVDLAGAKSSFDIEQIAQAEVVILDENSVRSLCGMNTNDVSACLNACVNLSSKIKAKYIVINLFSRGCFVYDGTYSKIISPFEYREVDETASHEAFCASLAYKHLCSSDIEVACSYACRVLGYVACRNGGLGSLPKAKDVVE